MRLEALISLCCASYGVKANQHDLPYANFIFNAVHSSMRQFGSARNHNGLSAFIATVPRGVELYHGTDDSNPVAGLEWLAFDPELASYSVQEGQTERTPMQGGLLSRTDLGLLGLSSRPTYARHARSEQEVLATGHSKDRLGYFHTYQTTRPLRLLYLDGLSAGLSCIGTLDLQDRLLFHDNPPFDPATTVGCMSRFPPPPDAPSRDALLAIEYVRAKRFCDLVATTWKGRIDGFIRTTYAHEIMLCNFTAAEVKPTRIAAAPVLPDARHDAYSEGFAYYQACATRFDGIGGNRVQVYMEDFVTLFAYPESFAFDARGLPRVINETAAVQPARDAITALILSKIGQEDKASGLLVSTVDWQSVADMIVSRYTDRIGWLASGDVPNLLAFRGEIDRALRPFADFSGRESGDDLPTIQRCAAQFLPASIPASAQPLVVRAILRVTTKLCETLTKASTVETLPEATEMIRELRDWLGWSSFKACRGCGFHEVCLTPMFPVGSQSDFESPHCTSDLQNISYSYWDAE